MLSDYVPIIYAINAGDKARARRLLQPILKGTPDAEAWYLASQVTEKPEHEIACLKRAVAADPRHMDARRRLNELRGNLAGTHSEKPLSQPAKPAQKPPELKKRRRKKRGTWFYLAVGSAILLSLSSAYFVLLVLGSSLPGRFRSLFTGNPPVTEIDGVPLDEMPDAVMKIEPSYIEPLEGAEPAGTVLEPGYVHEHPFNATQGEEVVIGLQFISPSAGQVNRNAVILDPNGRETHCDRNRVFQGDNGAMIVCNIHQSGLWKLRVLGIEGQSTGAYFVSIDRLID